MDHFPEQDNTNNKKLFKEAQLKNNEILFRSKNLLIFISMKVIWCLI